MQAEHAACNLLAKNWPFFAANPSIARWDFNGFTQRWLGIQSLANSPATCGQQDRREYTRCVARAAARALRRRDKLPRPPAAAERQTHAPSSAAERSPLRVQLQLQRRH
jgi:hypothetical protein